MRRLHRSRPTPTTTPTTTSTPSPSTTPTPPLHEDFLGSTSCTDKADNDNDGLIDCADPDCFAVPPCHAPVPTLSSLGLVLLVLALGVTGATAILKRGRWRA